MRSAPSSIARFGRRSSSLCKYSSYSFSVSHFFAYTSNPSSLSAATTESSGLKGLHEARRTCAPASRSASARTPVFASTWRAMPTRAPRSAFAFARSSWMAARTSMWARAHSRRLRPRSDNSDTGRRMRGGLHLLAPVALVRPLPTLPPSVQCRQARDERHHGDRVERGSHRRTWRRTRGDLNARRHPLDLVPGSRDRGGDEEPRRDRNIRGERRLEAPARVRDPGGLREPSVEIRGGRRQGDRHARGVRHVRLVVHGHADQRHAAGRGRGRLLEQGDQERPDWRGGPDGLVSLPPYLTPPL